MKPKIMSKPCCIESSIENALVNAKVGDYVENKEAVFVYYFSNILLFESSIFRKQKEADIVRVARKNTLFLTPQSMAMKKSLLILEGNTLVNIVRLLGKWSK